MSGADVDSEPSEEASRLTLQPEEAAPELVAPLEGATTPPEEPPHPYHQSLHSILSHHTLHCVLCPHTEDVFGNWDANGDGGAFRMFPGAMFPPAQRLLRHMAIEHHLVIAHVERILDLAGYLRFWHHRLTESVTLADIASQIESHETPEGPPVDFWLLSDILPEDRTLRQGLHERCLERVLDDQRREQHDVILEKQKCLFCTHVFDGKLAELFTHMFAEHGFHIGRLENLVFVRELLDVLETMVRENQCVYCGRVFPSYAVMKLHMRKKKHFKINSTNRVFDRFYVVNYRDGQAETDQQGEDDEDEEEGEEDDAAWGTWGYGEMNEAAKCLFCPAVSCDVCEHMHSAHGFDLDAQRRDMSLGFYDSVKLINYIRRQVAAGACPSCGAVHDGLLAHMDSEGHYQVARDVIAGLSEEYIIPTLENDPLLLGLDADDDGSSSGENA